MVLKKSYGILLFIFFLGSVCLTNRNLHAEEYDLSQNQPIVLEVSLEVLNPENSIGDILVADGDAVKIRFQVNDPLNESTPQDAIQLRRVGNEEVVSRKGRGNIMAGDESLGYDLLDLVGGEFVVEYLHHSSGLVIAKAIKTVTIVSDKFTRSLLDKISALQAN